MRVLFTVTDDWYFLSHRRNLAVGLLEAGHSVSVLTKKTRASTWRELEELGVEARSFEFDRTVLGQCRNAACTRRLARAIEANSPDILHNVSFLPQVFGTRAARMAGGVKVVNAVTGLGHAFSGGGVRRMTMRYLIEAGYRSAMKGSDTQVIFQNEDDLDLFISRRICRSSQAHLVAGSGVDVSRFLPSLDSSSRGGVPVVLHASRMLKTKGVYDSLKASILLEERGVNHKLILAGGAHPDNPASLTAQELYNLKGGKTREWIGLCEDMPKLLSTASVAVLPSRYREGVPMALLEAAACGLPIVTTDMPGCRDVVTDGVNGFLVPPEDSESLADAIETLLGDSDLRATMGAASREIACGRFSATRVVEETLALYESMLLP